MKYVVKWTQWFYSGPEGDDKDYEEMTKTYASKELADVFINNLVEGNIFKSPYACTVHRHEITVDTIKESV